MFNYWDTHPIIENLQPQALPFTPGFRQAYGYYVGNDGSLLTYPLNPDYFADQPTAQWISNRFGDGLIYPAKFDGAGGPFSVLEQIYLIKLKDGVGGRTANAGLMAAYFKRNPEDKFPGLAIKLIQQAYSIL